ILKDLLASLYEIHPILKATPSLAHIISLAKHPSLNAYTGEKFRSIGGRKPGEKGYFCRVNRAKFRTWISEHIPIQWNKTFSQYEEYETGVTVHFRDGTSATGDILYECQLALASSFYVVNGEGFRIFGGNSGFSEDKSTATYFWYICWKDEASTDHESYWTTHASKEELLFCAKKRAQTLHPTFRELVELTPVESVLQNAIRVRDWIPGDLPQLADLINRELAVFSAQGVEDLDVPKVLQMYQEEILERGRAAVLESRAAALDQTGRHPLGK
ncbi:hypothetical protein MMC18_008243, partial [Xylographa bjoerkii]|nr:hypothetical protein [Xylographa bjoerkii]